MRHIRTSSTQVSPAGSSPPELPPAGGLCAIHQPNVFPRLTTLAKLFTADYWIVLDDVQFARRDYQHRARLAAPDDPQQTQWLTIPTHLPHGRATTIREARLAEPARSQRRMARMLPQHYRTSPHWPELHRKLSPVLDLFATTDKIADIAEASTRLLLDLLGWQGQILHSGLLPARTGRSQRLADLAESTRARGYLCGTGGMAYVTTGCFDAAGVQLIPFRAPDTGIWTANRVNSALTPLMQIGFNQARHELLTVAAHHRATNLDSRSAPQQAL